MTQPEQTKLIQFNSKIVNVPYTITDYFALILGVHIVGNVKSKPQGNTLLNAAYVKSDFNTVVFTSLCGQNVDLLAHLVDSSIDVQVLLNDNVIHASFVPNLGRYISLRENSDLPLNTGDVISVSFLRTTSLDDVNVYVKLITRPDYVKVITS